MSGSQIKQISVRLIKYSFEFERETVAGASGDAHDGVRVAVRVDDTRRRMAVDYCPVAELVSLRDLTVPVSADMRLEEARPSTSLLQPGHVSRFPVGLAPPAPALRAGSRDLPGGWHHSGRPARLDRPRRPTPGLELF
jgi:hypothetical protein